MTQWSSCGAVVMMLTEAKLLQFGSVGVCDGGKLKVYVVVDKASTAPACERSQTALAQRIAESVIGEAAVWTWTRAGQVMLTHFLSPTIVQQVVYDVKFVPGAAYSFSSLADVLHVTWFSFLHQQVM